MGGGGSKKMAGYDLCTNNNLKVRSYGAICSTQFILCDCTDFKVIIHES